MSEEDVRGGLKDAVADEPPLDFDPDALVATARHQVTRRRALVAVGAATVAVAVAAVALPVVLGRQSTRAADRPAPSPSTSASTTSTSWPPPGVEARHYTAGELRSQSNEMARHLKVTVPAVLPEATDFTYGEFGGEAAGDFADGQNYTNAPISFTVGGARYSIHVTVWVPGAPNVSPQSVCATSDAYCRWVGTEDGGPLVSKTENIGQGAISTLYHFRKTGEVVQIAAYNYDMASTTTVTYMPTIPVTVDQQMRLATDPDLAL